MEKYVELSILTGLGIFITLYYIVNIFELTYMQVIKSACTRIPHPKKKLFIWLGLVECIYIFVGLLTAEKYIVFFIILLVWNLIWALTSPCKLGSDIKLYRFYTIMSFIVNFFVVAIISLWLGQSLNNTKDIITIPPQKPVEITKTVVHDTFSELLLKDEIKKLEIKFPDIVYAQARLETGNFKSDYFKIRNNLFGFRVKSGYMYFRHWKESVAYYANWQKKYYKSGDYYTFLIDINYAEDSTYINKVKLCIK